MIAKWLYVDICIGRLLLKDEMELLILHAYFGYAPVLEVHIGMRG
jgi:hypothetical protein